MTRNISFVNQKGGVGKTTMCANLADALALKGHKVVAVDMDPQGHLSQYLGCLDKSLPGVYEIIQGETSVSDVCVTLSDNLRLVPPGEKLMRLESVQMSPGRGLIMRKSLAKDAALQADFVLFDCPPSNGFLVINGIAASQELLVPVTPDFLGLSGLSEMTKQIKRYENVMGSFNHLWVVVSRFQHRAVSREAEAKIRQYFNSKVTEQVIHERAAIAESPGHGQSVIRYSNDSPSADEFMALASEIERGNHSEQK
ncbi:ParA family protein [Alteromonas facilis]|uniref:ParA family protein n=1 Tax=Alteromonas facilis TaxID=2048004 RepID=UPI000C291D17|nr:ParA family protein [Alteromonas facilis]